MDAKDLRIGNLVMAPAWRSEGMHLTEVETISKGWSTVDGKNAYALCINHGFVETGCEFGACIESDVQPIPVTHDWLVKLGFTNITDRCDKISSLDLLLNNDTIHFYANKEDDYSDVTLWWMENGEPSENYITRLKYVHELQNLVFALTRNELTIN